MSRAKIAWGRELFKMEKLPAGMADIGPEDLLVSINGSPCGAIGCYGAFVPSGGIDVSPIAEPPGREATGESE